MKIVFDFKFFQVDGDIEKPQAKKRRTEDSGSVKNTQNGKKRKRDGESDVSACYYLLSFDTLIRVKFGQSSSIALKQRYERS